MVTKSEKLRYSINGDRTGYLVASFKEKLSIKNKRGILDITDEEIQAWQFDNNIVEGVANVRF